jgi:hypothetical protein
MAHENQVIQAAQLGFDLDWHDPSTNALVPWIDYDTTIIDEIRNAPWKVPDLETTGLTPGSAPLTLDRKEVSHGARAQLRTRVISVLIPDGKGGRKVYAADVDKFTPAQLADMSDACMTGVVFGWNVGFDAYWLGWNGAKARPALLLDGMLIGRVMRPEQVVILANMASDESVGYELSEAAASVFMQRKSGWSLAHSTLANFHEIMDKGAQGPRNWTKAWLSQSDYDYATGDVKSTWRLLADYLGDVDLLAGYMQKCREVPALKLIEPQVSDVVKMRQKGMPWDSESEKAFQILMHNQVQEATAKLLELEPELLPFKLEFLSMSAGVTAAMRDAVAKAFGNLGVAVTLTEKSGTPQVGEKDLRRAKAQTLENATPLFNAWVSLSKAKKMAKMAGEMTKFSLRSGDGRIHALTGHGPVTGRLSSSEPNLQQAPRKQEFRNGVRARPKHKIAALDYSALDMRVGAALAIRAQRQIQEAYRGARTVDPDVQAVIDWVYGAEAFPGQKLAWARKREAEKIEAMAKVTEAMPDDPDKKFWERWRRAKRDALLARFGRSLAECVFHAREAGETEWGALREAFKVPDMDIHTWTGLKMMGEDPVAMFAGKSDADVAAELKVQKARIGDKRQNGKVGNLSLLYAMMVKGLLDTAAKIYNIHWTFEEGSSIRSGWFAAYPEVDLWHAWTELTPAGTVTIPDPDRGNRMAKKSVFPSWTLGGRCIYAFGLNAALSYEDQSTGADILGTVMHLMETEYPEMFDTIVNQVHDEIVFEIPEDKVDEYIPEAHKIMVECAERFLRPYGIRAECSFVVGDVWIKD